MTILIIHYHLRAGGVTRVIASQARVLEEMGHRVVIASSGPVEGWEFETLLVPELDYQKEGSIPIEPLFELKADFWIIHNPTLGLNSAYPDLIEKAAQSGTRILLQCHDFVEDGRPSNYQLMAGRERIYPTADHIHYAVINRRDFGILRAAGVPKQRCHYLPNAVNPPVIEESNASDTLVFYPVRGIRRKNLGEICLLAAHAPPGVRFAVALRAGPEEPAFIHDEWVRFAKELNLPVKFDVVGGDPSTFSTWLERASHLVTTSISEGFGLTFLDPAFFKKPLIGRDLPEITCDFVPYGTLYQSIPVSLDPLPWVEDWYHIQLAKTMEAYGRPMKKGALDQAWQNFSKDGEVDFGNLTEAYQRMLIREIRLPNLARWLANALEQPAQEVDTSPWTLETYAANLKKVAEAIGKPGPVEWIPRARLLDQFLLPERFHFLRTKLTSSDKSPTTS